MTTMLHNIKNLWLAYSERILITAFALVVVVCLAVVAAVRDNAPRTMADPPTESEITFNMEANRAYNADDGVVVIPASVTPKSSEVKSTEPVRTAPSEAKPQSDAVPTVASEPAAIEIGGNYTLPEDVLMEDGSIGLLSIPKLSLSVNVFETEDEMEAMSHGVAHFKTTSAWSGNIGLCSHNVNFDLTDGYFKNIHTLQNGDTISYTTALGSRDYTVETVVEIAETDWSYLGRTEDDRITLITCISGKPRSRLVVQAVAAD
jgi:LPXTG-site transpeptidase (sortase) family protein